MPRPTNQEKFEIVKQHAALNLQYKGEYTGVREMRKHLAWYSSGIAGGAKMRNLINEMETMEDILKVANSVFT